jgi:hypothetical protein
MQEKSAAAGTENITLKQLRPLSVEKYRSYVIREPAATRAHAAHAGGSSGGPHYFKQQKKYYNSQIKNPN